MTCPFLKEARVKYCRTSSVRKLIPLAQAARADEKCVSPEHFSCAVFGTQPPEADHTGSGTCPFLSESLMQYCSAAPVAKFIPYSESLLSRCGNDAYRYCELYLSMAHPGAAAADVDGMELPAGLQYSANHMWLDASDDGTCHAGIDAFLARTLGVVDRLSCVWLSGNHRPAAVLTVAGTDLQLVFPNPFLLTKCNLYLRADPSRLTNEPYTGGWLFEGVPAPETSRGLLRGGAARDWMEQEQRRINEFLQQPGAGLPADGGQFATGVARTLDREQRLALFQEFFSPDASGKREP